MGVVAPLNERVGRPSESLGIGAIGWAFGVRAWRGEAKGQSTNSGAYLPWMTIHARPFASNLPSCRRSLIRSSVDPTYA